MAGHRVAVFIDGDCVTLRKMRIVAPPLQLIAAHRHVIFSRDAALIEVKHEKLPGLVVAAEDRNSAWDLWLVDLRMHDEKGAALLPVKRCVGNVRMRARRLPLADQDFERSERRILDERFVSDFFRHTASVIETTSASRSATPSGCS